ncbi:peptidylprolyl isomerase [Pseudomonas sp. W3I7]|uniref:peptidylprolyl isomerase n=1 Tax=Pseudomonas sp. W3I7 TaxID=3042292 RepID=UPI0035935D4F
MSLTDKFLPPPQGTSYRVFGKVSAGWDVLDDIKSVKVGRGDMPVDTIFIRDAYVQA